jgi:hypothetical protein
MSEREVRLTAACLRAIAAGRKTQLRSVDKGGDAALASAAPCPLGAPGDLLRIESGALLRITALRRERLQAISEADLAREGGMWRETSPPGATESERAGFARWWDAVHARPEAQWQADPWVWVVTFERS